MTKQESWHFDRSEQHRLKKLRLLKAAAECFNEKGFSGTSLKDVAKKLNLTDAALYYYVKNKEELVNLCYLRATDLAEDALARARADGATSVEKLELFIRYQIEGITGIEGPVAIMSEIASLKSDHKEEILTRATTHQKRITRLIQDGVDEGTLDVTDTIAASNALLGAINWIPKWYKADSNLTGEIISDNFIQIFFKGMLRRP